MASLKRIGFFWGEDKITIVEFEKNNPLLVVSSPLSLKTNAASPFSSNLTEEIQITAILQKLLQDNRIAGGSFYVSLPMKEIILRSFIIPYVKSEDIQNAVKFEAKKYIPFDIQDLVFVFHTIPFAEEKTKRLQVIFFALRKEVLARYERIFKQVNAEISYCEPYMVSLTKALLYRKEIKPTDHLAFLILDKNLGRICFIDEGIPQFIREFPIGSSSVPSDSAFPQAEEANESPEELNLKIINEVGNSFDFYARQFSGERIDQMLVSSDFVQKDLLNALETEIKVKIRRFSLVVTTGVVAQSNDMEAIYAMGACVTPPIESLTGFNFLGDRSPKSKFQGDVSSILEAYKDIVLIFFLCLISLVGVYFLFRAQLKIVQKQYDQLSLQQGVYANASMESVQADLQQNIDKLTAFKNIRTKSDVSMILLRVASHLPKGAMLTELNINYDQADPNAQHVTVDFKGDVLKGDLNEQIAIVNQIFSDFKQDKELAKFFSNVSMASLNLEQVNGQKVTGFNIHCS